MQPSRHHLVPLALLMAGTAAAQTPLPSPQPDIQLFCPPGIDDASGPACIGASSVPQEGFLYPLGQDFFMTPAGKVGFGTTTPVTRLDVEGTGGNDTTLRLLTTNAGAGGILLQRSGGTPADWALTYDTAQFKRDFLIHDNVAAETRLRIDQSGRVMCEELHVGSDTAGLQFRPFGSSVSINYGAPGANPSTWMVAHPDRIECDRIVHLDAGAEVGAFSSIQFTEDDTFAASPPMIHMFEDGASNFDRMVLAHSEAFEDWGLRYDDDIDSFHFLAGGTGVMTVKLLTGTSGKVGIGDPTPSNILQIRQGSPTDPIADAWTTYSSRRWKENIQPIDDALGLVRSLRGVTFDWKDSGQHDLGMIAEEVAEVVPEVVAFEENGVDAQSIDYARLSAVLVEAVKEQDAQLAAQAHTIAEQSRAIEELGARLEALEQP